MRRLLALVLTLVLFTVVSCSNDDEPTTPRPARPSPRTTPRGPRTTANDFNQAQFEGEPTEGGRIVFGVESQIATLDPAGSLAQPSDVVTALAIYDPMITYEDGKYAGVLATDWTNSEDLKTWTFTLREGVEFTDGAAVQRRRGRHPLHAVEGPGHGLHLQADRRPHHLGHGHRRVRGRVRHVRAQRLLPLGPRRGGGAHRLAEGDRGVRHGLRPPPDRHRPLLARELRLARPEEEPELLAEGRRGPPAPLPRRDQDRADPRRQGAPAEPPVR